jgi:hypothetical protein
MKISIEEEKLRKFIALSEPLLKYLQIRESDIKMAAWENCSKALIILSELKQEIGLIEDKPDSKNKLKNHKLFP